MIYIFRSGLLQVFFFPFLLLLFFEGGPALWYGEWDGFFG